ncbi:hypothetical protein J6590_075889 [Homalodisca vitripennis]|nr:hypothetical protein J6590_075889 [Homalodisca vitripennis]
MFHKSSPRIEHFAAPAVISLQQSYIWAVTWKAFRRAVIISAHLAERGRYDA